MRHFIAEIGAEESLTRSCRCGGYRCPSARAKVLRQQAGIRSSPGFLAWKTVWLASAGFIGTSPRFFRNTGLTHELPVQDAGRGARMCRRIIGFELFCLAFLLPSHHAIAGGVILTPLQTQSTSVDPVDTNWGQGTPGINDPLTFDQFNPILGTLTSIDITLTATILNDYLLIFPNTPTATTLSVATSQTTGPSAVGPTVTFFGPNGTTQILGAAIQPVDFVQLTEPSGTWSSLLPITDPHFIPPTMTTQSFSLTLTAADALFSNFIGTGNVDLPVTATAFSSFSSSSSNGTGEVTTKANASVTIQYSYASIPEPSSIILLGLGIGLSFLATGRLRRRAACASQSDRT